MNKQVFSSGPHVPAATATNAAGGKAYALAPEERLGQLACVGTFADGAYTGAAKQVAEVLAAAAECTPEYVAKCAVYSRENSHLKDMPVVLLAHLSTRDSELFRRVFPRICDNGKQLRNFVQVIRSGVTGRRSLGTAPKRCIQDWFATRTASKIWYQSIGTAPTMGDVIKLARPRPDSDTKRALYGHLIGCPVDEAVLPIEVHELERWKLFGGTVPRGIPFERLTNAAEGSAERWSDIARSATWTQLRMNLNTFDRHGVFKNASLVRELTNKLRDPAEVRKAKAFPYQLLMAYQAATGVPSAMRNALQYAMETACENVPSFGTRVVVAPDVSGSMSSAVTGQRGSATSAARCIDVAALIASAIARKNPDTLILPFDTGVHETSDINPLDTIMSNAAKLARYGGGGTACAAPLGYMNHRKINADLVIYASDNESWKQYEQPHAQYGGPHAATCGTNMAHAWQIFKKRNPKAKLVCIDLQHNSTVQVQTDPSVLNIGGFSDSVFEEIAKFVAGDLTARNWMTIINGVTL